MILLAASVAGGVGYDTGQDLQRTFRTRTRRRDTEINSIES